MGTLGYKHTLESRERISESNRSRVLSAETRKKISDARKLFYVNGGTKPNYWLGKKRPKTAIEKFRQSMIGKTSSEKNGQWKGDEVGYRALHRWLERNFGAAKDHACMICGGTRGSKKMDWANLDGKYTRDPASWNTFCRKCHKDYDRQLQPAKI